MSFNPMEFDFFGSWYPILFAFTVGMSYGLRLYMRGPQCTAGEKVKDKVVVVTGANSGVGKEFALEMAKRGAKVYLACRDVTKGEAAEKAIKETAKNDKVKFLKLDLASFKSIREFADTFKENEDKLDILFNNAGVNMHPRAKTEDGFEMHFQSNYLGHFLLTQLLLDEIKAASPSRIINNTALAHQLATINLDDLNHDDAEEFRLGDLYAQSKLALVLFTTELAKRLEGSGVTVNVAHPGVVNTDGHRYMPFKTNSFISVSFSIPLWYLMKSAADGAQTALQVALAEEHKETTGKYFADCFVTKMTENCQDEEMARKLYELSMKLTGLKKSSARKSSD